jgi:hypothetical protein
VKLSALCIAAVLAVPAVSGAQQAATSAPDSIAFRLAQATPPPAPAAPPTGPDYPRGRISGLAFGDLYYNLQGHPDSLNPNIDGVRPIGRDLNGIQIRRIYFQLDNDLSVRWSTRFRLETDSKELTSGGKIGVFVKNAYLQGRNLFPRADGFFGLITTPSFDNVEQFWPYRALEKTIYDFRGFGSSSDLGLSLKGAGDAGHHFGYWALVGDGTGQKPENNRDKKWYLSLPGRFGDFRLEPYVDYETAHNGQDKTNYKVFGGWQPRLGAIGVEVLDHINHQRAPTANTEPFAVSVFGYYNMPTTEAWTHLALVGRVDFWDPNRNVGNKVNQRLWIGAVDWQPYRDVHIMPNVEALEYIAKGTAVRPPHNDVQLRITFYYLYSRPQSS